MRYEGRHRWTWWLLLLFLVVLMAAACTQAVIENVPDKSGVRVVLDWDAAEIPSGVKFYFYPAEGESVGLIQAETSSEGYQGELSVGRYRVLAYNTNTSKVSLSGMDNYDTATATAALVATRADGVTLIAQPALQYAATSSEALEVRLFESLEKRVVPRLLTKRLTLRFDTNKLPGVNSVEGELRGVYASVLLATGEATKLAREQAPRVGTSFNIPIGPDNATVRIFYFGILSPEEAGYKNEMPITLKDGTGWQQTTMVDMSQVLTDIAAREEDGELEFEMEDNIEIEVKPTPTGLSANVVSWTRYGDGEGEVSYINY